MPYEKGGYASSSSGGDKSITNNSEVGVNTMINERGLPPIPHVFWVDRLGFQQGEFVWND